MRKINLYIFCMLLLGNAAAQKLGTWKAHMPFSHINSLAEGNGEVWAATNSGLFMFDYTYNSVRTFTTVEGLGEAQATLLRYNEAQKLFMVVYANTNIDIIENENVSHYPDILKTPIIGKKQINHIYYYKNFAYLSCSFGIIRFDLDKREISESYQNLGLGGSSIEINSLTIFGDSIYAATPTGIIAASMQSPNLADYHQWKYIYQGNGCSQIITHENQIIFGVDSALLIYNNGAFIPYYYIGKHLINTLESNYGNLIVNKGDSIIILKNGSLVSFYNEVAKNHAIQIKNGDIYMADNAYGLIVRHPNIANLDYITPNGPTSKNITDMCFDGTELWIATTGPNQIFSPLYGNDRFSHYDGEKWNNFTQSDLVMDNMRDFYKIAVNPFNKKVYVGSFGYGMIELVNNKVSQAFIPGVNGCKLDSLKLGSYSILEISGLTFDDKGNLWILNPGAKDVIMKMDTNYKWESYNLGSLSGISDVFVDIVLDDLGQKWLVAPRGKGILVFDEGDNNNNTGPPRSKLLGTDVGSGLLPDLEVSQVAKDKDGNMWVATKKGLVVFYSPGNIFSPKTNFDAQRIVIMVDGKPQWLFGEDVINCVTVDPANRKWVGTRNGAYLISADGQKILKNYTKDNSPLISNFVSRIGVNPATGEVFFATDKGMVSVKGDAAKGNDNYDSLVVFPNPVNSNHGMVTIKGLMDNTNIKITDAAGNMVNEIQSNGGIATWDIKNFKGERVHTGVYLIFANTADASEHKVAKVLVFH